MLKRIAIISFSLTFILSMVVFSFAQDAPVEGETEPTVVEETSPVSPVAVEETTSEVEPISEETTPVVTEGDAAKQVDSVDKLKEPKPLVVAKSYNDGDKTYVNSSVKFKLSSSDNVELDKIEYQIDTSEAKKYEAPFAIETEGKHVIKYNGFDKSGNKENQKSLEVIVDNTTPEIVVNSIKMAKKIGAFNYVTKKMKFIVKVTDASSGVSNVEYTLDGVSSKYLSAFMLSGNNEVTLKLKAIDNVLNTTENFSFLMRGEDGKPVTVKVGPEGIVLKLDNEAPVVTIEKDKEFVAGTKKNVVTDDTTFTLKSEDAGSGVRGICVRIDGKGEFAPYLKPIKFTTNGDHIIEARSADKMGNMSKVTSISVYVDTISPKTTLETVE